MLYPFLLNSNESILEQDFYEKSAKYISISESLDECIKKNSAEFIVFGDAFSPTNNPVSKLDVELSLGAIYKRLNVYGDRYWQSSSLGNEPSEPIPFTQMPLNYTNAFGGQGHAFNEDGKGFGVSSLHGEELHWLANVEDPDRPVLQKSTDSPTVGFAPLPLTWSERQCLLGTYDDNYINNHMPGLAPDIDWSYFNVAPPDQRFKGYLCGDETFSITHMNESMPIIQGQLPRVNARCFVFQQSPDYQAHIDKHTDPRETFTQHPFIEPSLGEFKEISLVLDTVMFFPNDNLGVLVHRGVCLSAHPQGRDMLGVLLAHESFDEPKKSVDYFKQQFMLRTDPEEGFKYMMHSAPLIPYDAQCSFKTIMADIDTSSSFADNFERYAEGQKKVADEEVEKQIKALEDQGYTDEAQKIRDKLNNPLSVDDLPEQEKADLKKLQLLTDDIMPGLSDGSLDRKEMDLTKLNLGAMDKLFDEMEAQAEAKKEQALKEVRAQISQMENEFSLDAEQQAQLEELKKLINDEVQIQPLPRFDSFDNGQFKEQMQEAMQMVSDYEAMVENNEISTLTPEQSKQMEQLKVIVDSSMLEGAQQEVEDFQFDSYRIGAHFISESISPHPGEEVSRAEGFLQRYQASVAPTLDNLDIAFCQLHALQFNNLTMSKGLCEYSRWKNIQFVECDFHHAIFAHTHFVATHFIECKITGVNFGAAYFEHCRFENLHFDDVTIAKSNFVECEFVNCTFDERMDAWLETDVSSSRFTDCKMTKLNFLELKMDNVVFTRCDLSESNFLQMDLSRSEFIETTLKQTNFAVCMMVDCVFRNSLLHNTRFVGPCNLCGSDFSYCQIHDANLAKAYLHDCVFDHADISQSNFAEARLLRARFVDTIAQQVLMIDANLDYTDFTRANLFEANLMQASLKNARFVDANMYSASLLDVTIANTDFMSANLQNTILQDWRPIRD